MKRSFFILFTLLNFIACKQGEPEKKDNGLQEVRIDEKASNADIVRLPVSADKPTDTVNVPKIQLEESVYDFGEITEGGHVKHSFKFKIQEIHHSSLQMCKRLVVALCPIGIEIRYNLMPPMK